VTRASLPTLDISMNARSWVSVRVRWLATPACQALAFSAQAGSPVSSCNCQKLPGRKPLVQAVASFVVQAQAASVVTGY
jgi:hypothetical protein